MATDPSPHKPYTRASFMWRFMAAYSLCRVPPLAVGIALAIASRSVGWPFLVGFPLAAAVFYAVTRALRRWALPWLLHAFLPKIPT
jgi:hypothetical protein